MIRKSLGESIQLISGRDLVKSQYNSNDKGIPYIMGASNMVNGKLLIERWTETPTVIGEKGDLIISVKGTVGELLILEEEKVHLSRQVMAIRAKDNYDIKFIYYYLKYYLEKLKKKAKGMIPGITREDILQADFIDISINNQYKIIRILDQAQLLLDKRKEQIEYLDELVKSRFIEMFGDPFKNTMNWEKRTLNEVSLRKGEYGSGASATEYIKDYPRYIRITDINDNGKLNNSKVTIKNLSEYEKYKLNDGDILFARTGATVGKTFRYRESDGECLFAGYLIRFIPNVNIINPDFLFAFTKTTYYQSWVDAKQNTVAQPNINAKQYGEELEVILPPIELQNEFAEFVKQVDKLKFEMEKSLKELEDNFNSLMQKAFKGELF